MKGRLKVLVPSKLLWVLAVFLAFLVGYWLSSSSPETAGSRTETTARPPDQTNASAATLYVCPMMCVPPMKQPGKCPVCGMDLTPAGGGADSGKKAPTTLQLTPQAARLAQIQVAPVERKFVETEIRLFGRIEYDPVEQFKVTAFAPGTIDRIYVERAGQTVRNGDPLFDIHSPELFYLEQELFEVLKDLPYRESLFPARGQRAMRSMRPPWTDSLGAIDPKADPAVQAKQKAAFERLEKIRRKMQLLGLTDDAINLVVARGRPTGISTVRTPTTGVILEQNAYRGAYVNTGDTVFTVANPSYMWARLEAYESDFAWLRIGQEAEFQTDAFPGETFRGQVRYLGTTFDPKKRTLTVGVLHTDPKSRLAPSMLVRCAIRARMTADGVATGQAAGQQPPLVIPDSAPLITGERAVVYVAVPGKPDVYEGREIALGPRAKGYYIVRSGLEEGESVVVNGGFKIDSAVQILAKSSMMAIEGGRPALAHQYHGGSAAMPERLAPPAAMDPTEEHEDAAASQEGETGTGPAPESSGSRSYSDRLEQLMKKRQQQEEKPPE